MNKLENFKYKNKILKFINHFLAFTKVCYKKVLFKIWPKWKPTLSLSVLFSLGALRNGASGWSMITFNRQSLFKCWFYSIARLIFKLEKILSAGALGPALDSPHTIFQHLCAVHFPSHCTHSSKHLFFISTDIWVHKWWKQKFHHWKIIIYCDKRYSIKNIPYSF